MTSVPTSGAQDAPGPILRLLAAVVGVWRALTARSRLAVGGERGDVPGWVLICLMTAGLVVLIWAVAGPALAQLFQQAITSVRGP